MPSSPPTAAAPRYSSIEWMEGFERREQGPAAAAAPLHDRTSRAAVALAAVYQRLPAAVLSSQMWLAAGIVGVVAGVLAGAVEVVSNFLTDAKQGVCTDYYWVSRELCCLSEPRVAAAAGADAAYCAYYKSWATLAGDESGATAFVMYTVLGTACATLAAWLCAEFAPAAAGSGIVDIKVFLSGIRMPHLFTPKVLLVKSVGLCLAVGSGLSLGKEGPFVHLGCCVGDAVGRLFPKYRGSEALQRDLLSTSAAVGIAVAFGAPIGGVLFALEEVAYYFSHRTMLRSFLAATVSTLVLKSLDTSHTGRVVQFAVSYRHPWHWFELGFFALLGVLGGVGGAALVRLNEWCCLRRRALPFLRQHPVREVALLALLTCALNYHTPFLRRGMLEVLHDLFKECDDDAAAAPIDALRNATLGALRPAAATGSASTMCRVSGSRAVMSQLLVAAAVKLALTAATFGARLPAGIFVPSLFIGACFGRAVGMWTMDLQQANPAWAIFASCAGHSTCVVPGFYAIVGAAAMLAGVTRMTLSLVVIIFELTGGLDFVVPCMLVALTSKHVAETVLGVPSVNTVHLAMTDYPFVDVNDDDVRAEAAADGGGGGGPQADATIVDVLPASPHVVVLCNGMTLAAVKQRIGRHGYRWYPVVVSDDDSTFIGAISAKEARSRLAEAAAVNSDANQCVHFAGAGGGGGADWAASRDPCTMRVTPGATVRRVLHAFKALGVQYVVVARGAQLAGIVTRNTLIVFIRARLRAAAAADAADGALPRGGGDGYSDDDSATELSSA
jgi:chloride channel 3/4/5